MKYAKLKLIGGSYSLQSTNCDSLKTLAFFLSDDFMNFAEFYKQWINDPFQLETGGNICQLEKRHNIIVVELDVGIFGKEITPFISTIDQFLQIISTWEHTIKMKPPEILITFTNDRLEIEAKN